jgi:hypothetical protein
MTVGQALYFVGACFALKLSAMTTDDLEKDLGQAVLDSLDRAQITVKEAAAIMHLDESNFRKQLRGEPSNHISLTRLLRLPYRFWLWLSPSLIYLVAKRNAEEIAVSIGLRQ